MKTLTIPVVIKVTTPQTIQDLAYFLNAKGKKALTRIIRGKNNGPKK